MKSVREMQTLLSLFGVAACTVVNDEGLSLFHHFSAACCHELHAAHGLCVSGMWYYIYTLGTQFCQNCLFVTKINLCK